MRLLTLASLLLLLVLPLRSQSTARDSSNLSSRTEVQIKVIVGRGEGAGAHLRVQVMSSRGTPVDENFTDEQSMAPFRLFAGEYTARVSGSDLVEPVEQRFSIYPREAMRAEYVTVKFKSSEDNTSSQGYISANTLKIPEKARAAFDKGYKAMVALNYGDARKNFDEAARIYPHYAEALNALGVIAMKANQPEAGLQYFERAIQADDQHPAAYVNLAKIYMNQQKFADGEVLLQKALGFTPLDVEALSIFSYYELNLGKYDAAVATAHKVHTLPHQKYAMVHYVAAAAFEKRELNKEAIEEYKLFIAESPAGPSVERARSQMQTLEARLH